jgi:hypothetical protein
MVLCTLCELRDLYSFSRHSVSLIVSLSIEAFTGCPGRYKPPTRQKWHVRDTLKGTHCIIIIIIIIIIIRAIKSRTILVGHVACIGEKRKAEGSDEKHEGNKPVARPRNR